jgi:serine/threonine protein kinase
MSALDRPSLTAPTARRLDQACDRFEAAWKAATPLRLEDVLDGWQEPERTLLLQELIAVEVHYRQERGLECHADEFLRRFPGIDPAWLATILPPLTFEPLLEEIGRLGDFHLLRKIGQGGMGVVYEAEQISLGRRVALKVLPFAATMDARRLKRFQNEARAAAGLHHTNIVPVHFVGCERGVHYYAMQFIDGHDLASVIRACRAPQPEAIGTPVMARSPNGAVAADRRSPVPDSPGELLPAEVARSGDRATTRTTKAPAEQPAAPAALPGRSTLAIAGISSERSPRSREHFRTVARLGIQAAEALDHAHQQGIVHRDIKPANLLVDADGQLWVTDFGLAQFQTDAGVTMTGDLVGTIRYMSPEQALAKRVVVDHRTDIYSLGVTLYELLTLEPAFKGGDRQELLRQIAFEEPTAPRRLNRAIPMELETITAKAMEKNPAERYCTAKEMAEDLQRFLRDEPTRGLRGAHQPRPERAGLAKHKPHPGVLPRRHVQHHPVRGAVRRLRVARAGFATGQPVGRLAFAGPAQRRHRARLPALLCHPHEQRQPHRSHVPVSGAAHASKLRPVAGLLGAHRRDERGLGRRQRAFPGPEPVGDDLVGGRHAGGWRGARVGLVAEHLASLSSSGREKAFRGHSVLCHLQGSSRSPYFVSRIQRAHFCVEQDTVALADRYGMTIVAR